MTTTIQKTYAVEFKAADAPAGATRFTATITTATLDRDNEVMIPDGMNAKEYEANPVLLYSHDTARPIGKMLKMRRGDASIDADFALAPRPDGHEGEWFPDTVGALIRFGAIRGVSIAGAAAPGGLRTATKADRERFGEAVTRVFSRWKLLEISVVSVPANAEALISAVSKGLVTRERLASMGIDAPAPSPEGSNISNSRAVMLPVRHTIRVSLPRLGGDDLRKAARIGLARARGRFRID